MNEREFQKELEQAKYSQKCDDRHADYWMGYILGLHRGYHGEVFQCEYEALMADKKRKGKGEGFRDGLAQVKFYERKTWPVVFAVHYGIRRFNPDGSERDGDLNYAGNFEDLDEAIKNAREWFDSQVQEMKCHSYRTRKEEQAFAYVTPVYSNCEDYTEAETAFMTQELIDKINSGSLEMDGSELDG